MFESITENHHGRMPKCPKCNQNDKVFHVPATKGRTDTGEEAQPEQFGCRRCQKHFDLTVKVESGPVRCTYCGTPVEMPLVQPQGDDSQDPEERQVYCRSCKNSFYAEPDPQVKSAYG